MKDIAGVQKELRRIYRESRRDPVSVDVQIFGKQIHLLNSLAGVMHREKELMLEERLTKLEESLAPRGR